MAVKSKAQVETENAALRKALSAVLNDQQYTKLSQSTRTEVIEAVRVVNS